MKLKTTLCHIIIAFSSMTLLSVHSIAQAPSEAMLCFGCHGKDGIGLSEEFPHLAGQSQYYLAKQLKAFRSGERVDSTMNLMAKQLSDGAIDKISHWYASLSPKSTVVAGVSNIQADIVKQYVDGEVYATLKGGGSIAVIHTEKTWEGGPNMLYNAITPDQKTLVATSPSTDSLYIFDVESGQTKAIVKVGKLPKGVEVSPKGNVAYVADEGGASISVVDIEKSELITTIPVEPTPHNVRFTQDGSIAYVTLQGGAGLGVIDTNKHELTRVIPVPGIVGPHNVDLSPDEKTAYIRDFVNHVAVLDLTTQKVMKVIQVGSGHGGIDVSPNGSVIATASIGTNFISTIDPNTFERVDVNVGDGPHGVRTSSDGQWIYVTVAKENKIVIVDANKKKVVGKLNVGQFPFWLSVPGNR